MAEWLIVPFQAGCMNRVVERRSMIHRYVTNIPIRWRKPEVSNLPVSGRPTNRSLSRRLNGYAFLRQALIKS
jgi:hypothetical protein